MRQFLYLDTDIVNSIIAQAENGLIESKGMEEEYSDTSSDKIDGNIGTQAMLGGSLAKLAKVEANLSGKISGEIYNSTSSTSREIVSKTLHDAAFSLAYENIDIHKIDPDEQIYDEIGNYLELTRCFDFIDFEYLERLFAKEGIVDFLKFSEAGRIEETVAAIKGKYNRNQQRNAANEIKKETQKLVAAETKNTMMLLQL